MVTAHAHPERAPVKLELDLTERPGAKITTFQNWTTKAVTRRPAERLQGNSTHTQQ